MKVLVTCEWDPAGLERVKADFPSIEWVHAVSPEERLREIGDADVVYGHVDPESFRAAKKLRWIHSHSAGADWVRSVPELVESDVVVTNTSGGHADTISEHTIGMLISLTRGFPQLMRDQEAKQWVRPMQFSPVGLSGRTMGIVGLGNIGTAIARVASALRMRVIAVDVDDVDRPEFVDEVRGTECLNSLLSESDAVVVTVPYTPETVNMIGDEQIQQMRDGSYLVAISRGGIVDEAAMISALETGKLAGAAVDVTAVEPLPPEDPLWDAPNLIITPHCCGFSEQTFRDVTEFLRTNLNRYLEGQPLVNVVDKRRGF